jgi:type VI secretion system secreted protein Hcp
MAYNSLIIIKWTGEAGEKTTFDILSYSWGVTQVGGYSYGTGGTTSKAQIHDLNIAFRMNEASPKLMQYCATGRHIDKVTILVIRAGDDEKNNKPYLTIDLTDVIVSSYQSGGRGDDKPIESIGLNFAKAETRYDASGLPK